MQLNDEQKEKLLAKLRELPAGGDTPCTLCGNTAWNVSDRIFALREYHDPDLGVGGAVMPLIAIGCGTCGHMVLVSAVQIGVLPPFPDSKTPVQGPKP